MTMFHAVVWIDHQSTQILQFDAEHIQAQKVKAHSHHTRQHGSNVRTEHEYYAEICDALAGIAEVLAVGPKTGLVDFRHYVEKHRPALASRSWAGSTATGPARTSWWRWRGSSS